jgi:hypothetical protein
MAALTTTAVRLDRVVIRRDRLTEATVRFDGQRRPVRLIGPARGPWETEGGTSVELPADANELIHWIVGNLVVDERFTWRRRGLWGRNRPPYLAHRRAPA